MTEEERPTGRVDDPQTFDPGEVDDVVMGCAMQQGTTGNNIARQSALRAGLPNSVSGMTIDRQCRWLPECAANLRQFACGALVQCGYPLR